MRFARTSRCAIVGSDTRNARAISSVPSPHTRRSVIATWLSVESAGWQHVNTSRRRSSGRPAGDAGAGGPSRAIASCFVSWSRSRRSVSIARCFATVTSHAAGFRGTPSTGQRSSAATRLSWNVSSARSTLPSMRTSIPTTRADSRRTRSSISPAGSGSATQPAPGPSTTSAASNR
jgi:hypothetical protein